MAAFGSQQLSSYSIGKVRLINQPLSLVERVEILKASVYLTRPICHVIPNAISLVRSVSKASLPLTIGDEPSASQLHEHTLPAIPRYDSSISYQPCYYSICCTSHIARVSLCLPGPAKYASPCWKIQLRHARCRGCAGQMCNRKNCR
jgi:hypothetical protein